MADLDHDRPTPTGNSSDRRRLVGVCIALVAVFTGFSAAAGYVLPVWAGLEEVTVLAITFTVSPGAFALYGAVTTATFLVTLLLVLWVVSQFDELEEFEDVD